MRYTKRFLSVRGMDFEDISNSHSSAHINSTDSFNACNVSLYYRPSEKYKTNNKMLTMKSIFASRTYLLYKQTNIYHRSLSRWHPRYKEFSDPSVFISVSAAVAITKNRRPRRLAKLSAVRNGNADHQDGGRHSGGIVAAPFYELCVWHEDYRISRG